MIWRACFDYPDKRCGWWEPTDTEGQGPGAAGGESAGPPSKGTAGDARPNQDWVVAESADGLSVKCSRLLWSVNVDQLGAVPPAPEGSGEGPLEVRWQLRVKGSWKDAASRITESCLPQPWHLLMEGLFEGDNDDLGDMDELLTRARLAGCAFVTLVSPEGSYSYRYRVTSLVRYLCDEHRLRFGVLEIHERPNSDYLNRYFASFQCCRGLPRPAVKVPVKKLGLG